jgi:serine/threonine-protein kinase HipA
MTLNQDDHVKNFSFHVDRSGSWSLTPAYDITSAYGTGWTRAHQLRIRDRVTGIREEHLLHIARELGIKKPGRVLEQIRSAIADWERFAGTYDVPPEVVRRIRKELDTRGADLR